MLKKALTHFECGEYKQCYILLKILADECKNVSLNKTNANFILTIYCSYSTVTAAMGKKNEFIDKLKLTHKSITPELQNHISKIYCIELLSMKHYTQAKKYMKYLQPVNGPTITPNTMSYFKENDIDKTLLIYSSGGIGDIIMYSRFIKKICETQSKNKILFFTHDHLCWLFHDTISCSNLRIIPYSISNKLNFKYDYHTNITMLLHILNLTYETIYIDYYLESLIGNSIDLTNIINPHKKNVVINWSGNKQNVMEQYNRSIELDKLIPLFRQYSEHINWISLQKSLSSAEIETLNKYNIKNCGHFIDTDGNAFKDSVTILKASTLVISTDTSLIHLVATMNLKCWCLLTIGCDWRWVYEDNKWYPNVLCFRQKKLHNWDNVVGELSVSLSTI